MGLRSLFGLWLTDRVPPRGETRSKECTTPPPRNALEGKEGGGGEVGFGFGRHPTCGPASVWLPKA